MRTIATILAAMLALALATSAFGQTVNICDRTPQVRDAILNALGLPADGCANVDSGALAQVTSLKTKPAALQAGDFAGLTSLQELNLYSRGLTTLPDGLFAGLTSLQELTWRDPRGELTTLPPGVFAGLTSLTRLDFDGKLTTLPPGVFAGLTSLQVLILGRNELTTLPDGVFAGLTSLQGLYLNYNELTTLPPGVFAGLTSLQTLNMEENKLATLPDGLFAGLTSLQTLKLEWNEGLQLTRSDPLFAALPSKASVRLPVIKSGEYKPGTRTSKKVTVAPIRVTKE